MPQIARPLIIARRRRSRREASSFSLGVIMTSRNSMASKPISAARSMHLAMDGRSARKWVYEYVDTAMGLPARAPEAVPSGFAVACDVVAVAPRPAVAVASEVFRKVRRSMVCAPDPLEG